MYIEKQEAQSMNGIVAHKGFMRLDNLEQAKEVAKIMIESGIVPDYHLKTKNPVASVLMCLQKGLEVGLSPTQSIQDIANINGRTTVWGDASLALCKVSPDYEYCIETFDEKTQTATCRAKRKGEEEVVKTFSLEEAKAAGLADRQVWKSYRRRMLQMRARGFAIRDAFPHVLKGLHLAEEYIGVHGGVEINPIERTVEIAPEVVRIEEKKPVNEAIKEKLQKNFIHNTYPQEEIVAGNQALMVTAETLEKLNFLAKVCNVPEATISKWLKKANVSELSQLTEEQAQKVIDKLEEEAA